MLPRGSGWEGARDIVSQDLVRVCDHDAKKLTPGGRRFIEMFTTVERWKKERGADAYMPDIE